MTEWKKFTMWIVLTFLYSFAYVFLQVDLQEVKQTVTEDLEEAAIEGTVCLRLWMAEDAI